MPKFFVNKNQIEANILKIQGEDVNHIKNVLRYEIGDSIVVCADGENYSCRINQFDKDEIICDIQEKIDRPANLLIKNSIFDK